MFEYIFEKKKINVFKKTNLLYRVTGHFYISRSMLIIRMSIAPFDMMIVLYLLASEIRLVLTLLAYFFSLEIFITALSTSKFSKPTNSLGNQEKKANTLTISRN